MRTHRARCLVAAAAVLVASVGHAEVAVSFVKTVPRTKSPGILFNNGALTYSVLLNAPGDKTADPESMKLAGIGLYPSKRGWSGIGNMLQVSMDGMALFPRTFKVRDISSCERGAATLETTTPKGVVKIIFATDTKADALYVSLRISTTASVRNVVVSLRAYPGEFQKSAARRKYELGPMEPRVLTATREMAGPGTFTLRSKAEPWMLLFDAAYDPAHNRTRQYDMCACGLLYNPKDVAAVKVQSSRGGALVELKLPGAKAGGEVATDFVLWQFNGSNAEGREAMKALVLWEQP